MQLQRKKGTRHNNPNSVPVSLLSTTNFSPAVHTTLSITPNKLFFRSLNKMCK
jgi:hypothetical protein